MLALILLGLLGGLVTGISPCILPVLPVIFWTGGADSARFDDDPSRPRTSRWRPYQVVGGLVLSFSAVTLLGSLLLGALHLPHDLIRWFGIGFLILVGLGMIVPRLEQLIERPFSWVPQRQVNTRRGGFLMGLALGAVYVPCAGPVLAAITVAGATGRIGPDTLALTLSFAVGTAVPLLFFALAGRGLAERLKAFRRRQRMVRTTAGILVIALAVGLALDFPAAVQRSVPDYTASAQELIDHGTQRHSGAASGSEVSGKPGGSGDVDHLASCQQNSGARDGCSPAPELRGITGWLNTEGGKPVSLESQRGKVVLVDFWAYSCINCQRTIPHLNALYSRYKDAGLEIVGVHTPEYAFEHETDNVAAGIREQKIAYPVAQDNDYATWKAYDNHYWPAHYLVDASGRLRASRTGEGGYDVTESQIRTLLKEAHPGIQLPAPVESGANHDNDDESHRTPETYLGTDRAQSYVGEGTYSAGNRAFSDGDPTRDDSFTLYGNWNLSGESIRPRDEAASLSLNFTAKIVQVVASGTGTIDVETPNGHRQVRLDDQANSYDLINEAKQESGQIKVTVAPGVKLYSFTFG
ncbi:cytochrome c biogenesis protein DipZ [Rothia uropygioeca]|uniref:cytochrome c biogenesis protein DipZ n=1 Tax=Kocuria sp. 257 TaxID=2021970 RepID=UPI00101040B3|nr:cytochrome c biogenesis protein DipZ [Kocuria sp. 257]